MPEIVHDDDVSGHERRHQDLLDIEPEQFTIDRAVDHTGRRDAIAPQRRQERHGVPTPVRHIIDEPLAAQRPASERRQVGLRPGFINEDKAIGIDAILIALPSRTFALNVRAILLAGAEAFFCGSDFPV